MGKRLLIFQTNQSQNKIQIKIFNLTRQWIYDSSISAMSVLKTSKPHRSKKEMTNNVKRMTNNPKKRNLQINFITNSGDLICKKKSLETWNPYCLQFQWLKIKLSHNRFNKFPPQKKKQNWVSEFFVICVGYVQKVLKPFYEILR